VNLNDALLDA